MDQIEKATSLERLDQSLVVVRVRGWLLLCFFLGLLATIIAWAFLGTLPITVDGKCLVFDFKNLYEFRNPEEGVVKEVLYFGGQRVKQGEPIVIYENPASEIVAPMDGEVLWVDLKKGNLADPQQIAVAFQGHGPVTDLQVLGFVPLRAGQKIELGMQTLVSLDNAPAEKYGMIQALVDEVFPYPVGPREHYMRKIPSQALIDYLTQSKDSPTILILAKPLYNPNTPSKLAWTSEKGLPQPIFPGALGEMRILLKKVRPISYVLPQKE